MRFGNRSRLLNGTGWRGTQAAQQRESAVGVQERPALLDPEDTMPQEDEFPEAHAEAPEEPYVAGDPTQRLLTALGRFQRQVSKAEAGAPQEDWCDECMNQLISGIEIAVSQGWDNVRQALTDTARVLQTYEEAERAGACVVFLQDSYEILCLMVGDIIVDNVRSGVMRKWQDRYGCAVSDLREQGLQLIEDEDEQPTREARRGKAMVMAAATPGPDASAAEQPVALEAKDTVEETDYEDFTPEPEQFESAEEASADVEEEAPHWEDDAAWKDAVEDVPAEVEEMEEEDDSPFDIPKQIDADTEEQAHEAAPTSDGMMEEAWEEDQEDLLWDVIEAEEEPAEVPTDAMQEEVEAVSLTGAHVEAAPAGPPEVEAEAVPEAKKFEEPQAEPELIADEFDSEVEALEAPDHMEMPTGEELVEVEQEEAAEEPQLFVEQELEEQAPPGMLLAEEPLAAEMPTGEHPDLSESEPERTPVAGATESELEPAQTEDSLQVLMRTAQEAVSRGDVSNAKMLALQLAAAMAQLETDRVEQEVDKAERQLEENARAAAAGEEELRQAEQNVQQAAVMIGERQKDHDNHREQITAVRERVTACDSAIKGIEEEIRSLQAQLEAEMERREEVERELDDALSEDSRLQTELEELAELEQSSQQALEEARDHLARLREERTQQEAARARTRQRLEQQRASVQEIQHTLGGAPAGDAPAEDASSANENDSQD